MPVSIIQHSMMLLASGVSGSEDYRYTGKHEEQSGLYYFGARYYNPVLGRFIAKDTVLGSLSDPQSQNRYVYCQNNPQKYIDPDGRMGQLVIGSLLGPAGWIFLTGCVIIAYGPQVVSFIGGISSSAFRSPKITDQLGYIDDVPSNPNTLTNQQEKNERTAEKWDKHDEQEFRDHSKGPIPTTEEEYINLWDDTQNLNNNPQNKEYHYRDDGTRITYDRATNNFAITDPGGGFNNFYPSQYGETYYWRVLAQDLAMAERQYTINNSGG